MRRIIIADDEPVIRFTLAIYLEDAGYSVRQADSVEETLALFDSEGADILFIDWHMPGGGGAEILPLLAARAPTLPVVVISGTNDVADVVRALQLGAWDFITKPICDLAHVEKAAERCFARAQLLREEGQLRANLEKEVRQRARELEEANRQLLREMAERREFEMALAESESRFRQLVENIREVFWVRDVSTNRLLYISPACSALLGSSPEELLVLPELLADKLHPDDRDDYIANGIHRVRRGIAYDGEVRMLNANGQISWLRLRAFPVADATGRIYRIAGVIEDVTSRRRSEERILTSLREKDILLKEVHHRVKNNLQLVVSLLNLQSNTVHDIRDRDLFLDSRNRIASMALVHEELYRSDNLSGIDFSDYLPKLAQKLRQAFAVDVELDLQLDVMQLFLPVDTAIPCGLILNELLTNAFKHAFVGRKCGRIAVSVKRAEGDKVSLLIADDGVGMPQPFHTLGDRTLGVQLVRSLVQQLGGELVELEGEGTQLQITFSLHLE